MTKKNQNVKGYYNEKIISKFTLALREAIAAYKADPDLYHVNVSRGNRKMGDVPSVSTVPFLSCPGICKDTCGKKCYAAKIANLYPQVLKAYAMNQAIAIIDPEKYFREIKATLKGFRFFRYHVSGDILNPAYFENMVASAIENPHCDILVFTKRFEIVNAWIFENGDLPKNLHIIFSAWENLDPVNPYELPESLAIEFDKVDFAPDTLPTNYKMCGGNCFNCACYGLGCWQVKAGETVCFKMH